MDSAIKFHGGKSQLAPTLINLFPPHLHYVEPFFGGGSILFNKPNNLIVGHSEVVNDLDHNLINFWRVLQDYNLFEQFTRIVNVTPFSEYEFDESERTPPVRLIPSLDDAVRFFIRNRQSRQGLGKDFATLSRNRVRTGRNEQVSAWLNAIEGLEDFHSRLQRVVLLNRKAIDVIKTQDGPNTFFMLDPPYVLDTRVSKQTYSHEMTNNEHSELLELLAGISGKFLLCGYPNSLYDSVGKACNWTIKDFSVICSSSSKSTKDTRIERTWRNYVIS